MNHVDLDVIASQFMLINSIFKKIKNSGYIPYKNKFDILKQVLTTAMQYQYL